MSTSGFNFQAAQQYLQQENARAAAERKDNATYNDPNFPSLHDRRCMAVALGSDMYNIDFMDGEGDMVVSLDELTLDNPPAEKVEVDIEVKGNVTQEEKETLAEMEIPSRMRILICGDQEWDDVKAIKDVLEELPRSTVIIHGDDIGVATIAGRCATLCGMEVKPYLAQLETEGMVEESVRNTQILKESNPDVVIYFHKSDIAESKATRNMVEQAEKAGVHIINGNGEE
jgi:hypothetical protein